MSTKKRVAIHTLGCKVNSYESQSIEENLVSFGYEIVPFDSVADVYIINTCTVTRVADKKSRQIIRRAKNLNPNAVVVALGCYVEKNAEVIRDDCDIIIGNNKKSEVVNEIESFLESKEKSFITDELFSKDTAFEKMKLTASFEKTRAFIKIQDGCNAYCTYCVIPYVRGVSRSRKIEDILEEIRAVSNNGHSEIVLCAINLSDFNDNGRTLDDLVLEIDKIDTVRRIRLGSLEPDIFTDRFVKILSESKKICPHFHLSLQSANDNTLKNMKRRYSSRAFDMCVNNLRKYYDNPAICADVIAGFPKESDEDFMDTYKKIKAAKLYELHVFPYSEREGTKATQMDGKLDKSTKTKRAQSLLELSGELSNEYRSSLLGKNLSVLFEEKAFVDGKEYWMGFCGEYVRCLVESDLNLKGKIYNCKAIRFVDSDNISVSLQF